MILLNRRYPKLGKTSTPSKSLLPPILSSVIPVSTVLQQPSLVKKKRTFIRTSMNLILKYARNELIWSISTNEGLGQKTLGNIFSSEESLVLNLAL